MCAWRSRWEIPFEPDGQKQKKGRGTGDGEEVSGTLAIWKGYKRGNRETLERSGDPRDCNGCLIPQTRSDFLGQASVQFSRSSYLFLLVFLDLSSFLSVVFTFLVCYRLYCLLFFFLFSWSNTIMRAARKRVYLFLHFMSRPLLFFLLFSLSVSTFFLLKAINLSFSFDLQTCIHERHQ